MVFHTQSNVIAGLETCCSQHIGKPDSAFVKLCIRDDFAGLGKNDSGTVGVSFCMNAWVHGLQTSE
jgi:hypothetical protein